MRNSVKLALLIGWLATLVASAAAGEELPFIGDVPHGAALYRVNCAVCHGFDGSGKGPAARALKMAPAEHGDGSLMNSRDNEMIFRVIQEGCRGSGCKGAMPPFGDSLGKLDTWDLVAYLRSLHLPITAFFPQVDQYLVKRYGIGGVGSREFREGQQERLKQILKKVDEADLTITVFTLFRADRRRTSPELVPQEPRRLAQMNKSNKIGYLFFMDLTGLGNKKIPVGMALDTNYTVVKLVTTLADPALDGEYNQRLEKYVGLGSRGDRPDFSISKDGVGKAFDQAALRVYALGVEAANVYEHEERERSWADGTF